MKRLVSFLLVTVMLLSYSTMSAYASNTCNHRDEYYYPAIGTKIESIMSFKPWDEVHISVQTLKYVCAKCGAIATWVDEWYDDHSFVNGVCHCGYSKPGYDPQPEVVTPTPETVTPAPITPAPATPTPVTPATEIPPIVTTAVPGTAVPDECTHLTKKEKISEKWAASDEEMHAMITVYHYYCDCGQKNYTQQEEGLFAHQLVDGVCRLCGHVSELSRYKLCSVSDYYSEQSKRLWMSVGNKVQLFVTDRVTGITHMPDAINTRLSLKLIDTNECVKLNGKNEIEAIGVGSMLVSLYLDDTLIDYIEVDCSTISVEEHFWYDEQAATRVVTNYDMTHVDWNEYNVSLATTISIEGYFAKREIDPNTGDVYYLVTFNAYNSSPMVMGVASYSAEGEMYDQVLLDGFWPESTYGGKIIKTFAATERVFDGRSGNEQLTKKTEVTLRVPIGGHIHVQQMNDDDRVEAANIGQVALAVLKDLSVYRRLKDGKAADVAVTVLDRVNEANFGEIFEQYVIKTYGYEGIEKAMDNFYKKMGKKLGLSVIRTGAKNFDELFADEAIIENWIKFGLELAYESGGDLISSTLKKQYANFEDFLLEVTGKEWLAVARAIMDEGRYSMALLEGFVNCNSYDGNYRYIEFIKFPEK